MKRKFISAFLSASLILSLLPTFSVMAADYNTPQDWIDANSSNLAAADGVVASNSNSGDEYKAIDGNDSTSATWIIMNPNNLNQFFTVDLGAPKKVAGLTVKNIKNDRSVAAQINQTVDFYGSNTVISRASDMASGATHLGNYTVTNTVSSYTTAVDNPGEYRYIYMVSHGSQAFNITLGEFYIWSEPCDVFGNWSVNDATANVSFTVPVDYMDPSVQQSFTMRLTKYDDEGKMLSAPVDTVIDSDTDSSTQNLTASITLGLTDCVQAALFDEDGKLITQYSYGFDGFNAEKGTADTFENAFGYSVTETSATVDGKSVTADDIITVEAIMSDAMDEETAFAGKTFSDMYYVAQTLSKNGYSVTIPFDGADTGTYYIRTTRKSADGEEYIYRKFSFVDPVERQACIDAFLAEGADFGLCLDDALTLGILAEDSLIDIEKIYEDEFDAIGEDITGLLADDEVNVSELVTMLNTATVVYALSKGETEIMNNDEYVALVKDGGVVEDYVGEELGYSLTATVTTESNLTGVTNLGESGIIVFDFAEGMEPSSFEDGIVIKKDGEAVEIASMEVTEDYIKYYVTAFEKNSNYTVTFKSGEDGCLTLDGKKMLLDISFELSTGDILDVEYVEGKVLKNIAKNKPILNVDEVTTSNGVSPAVIVDGNRGGSESRITSAGADPIIDLGSYYMPVYMRIDYYGGTNNWWNCDGVTYQGSGYPLMTDEGDIAENGLDGENGVSLYVSEPTSSKVESVLSSGEYISFADKGYGDAISNYGPIRYVQLQIKGDSAMFYEFELYAYVDSEIGELSVNNEEFTEGASYTFEAPVTENAGEKTYAFVIGAYDENGITTKSVVKTVSASNGKISASISNIPAGSIGVCAMVVDDISTMNQLCNALTIGETVPNTDAQVSSGIKVDANTQKISVNVGKNSDIIANSQYAITVISADGFTGEAIDVFASLTDTQMENALVFSAASRVKDGVVFDIDDLPEGKYYIQVVANTFDKSKRAVKYFKQAILSENATDGLVSAIMNSNGNELKTAINNAVYVEEAISTDLIAEKSNLTNMLNDERFIKLLAYTRDMIYPEGTDVLALTLADMADVINAASAVYALDKGDTEKSKTLLASYGTILGDSYIAASNAEKLTSVFAQFKNKITSGNTLSEVIEWSCLLSFVDGALDSDVAEAFEDYDDRLGIDLSYATSKKVSLTLVAKYFSRSDLSKIYGATAFNEEFEKATKKAKSAKDSLGGGTGGGNGGAVTGGGNNSVNSYPKDETPKPIATPKPTTTPTASASGFDDMQSFAWADEAVASLKDKGIIAGNEKGEFEPTRNVTRAEFVKMLVMAADIRVDEGAYMSFMDVSEDSWYFPYIKIAFSRNICRGVDNFHFNPHGNITRQDMAVMLQNFLSYLGVGANGEVVEFTDEIQISDYAQSAVETASKAGLINGFEDGSFRPKDNTRRVDAAMVIYKATKMLK